jgi:endonuclease G, mitochondrial
LSPPPAPFRGHLRPEKMQELLQAAVQSGLVQAERTQRTNGINPGFVANMHLGSTLLERFEFELIAINDVERLLDGTVPITIYLDNCTQYLRIRGRAEANLFAETAIATANNAHGFKVQLPTTLPEIRAPEAIIGRDEMLDFAFLRLGQAVGRSVCRIAVPRFDQRNQRHLPGGAPWVLLGTAWVLADGYVLTNHHVVNARTSEEAPASAEDLLQQARSSEIEFDLDAPHSSTTRVAVEDLVVSDARLDYALLKVATTERAPLARVDSTFAFRPTSWQPVNIIQHPRGEYKRLGIRSNLVTAATATEIRYFTDTDIGSSGSPVCDDNWRVVALHRGAVYVTGVDFQGKDSAYVNYGSQIAPVIADICAKVPELRSRVAAGI